ncbi:MAG: hypothetical protein JJE21_03235, partial [Spirochaetaceae bacterium]|nr:hypothetical protein [Spirochaetaceae bacterium]
IILNVRANITTKDAIKELLESLVTVEEKISGVVLNGFVPSKSDFGGNSGDYGYSKYGYSSNYGSENPDDKKAIKLKKISQAKARRIAIKQYKINLENRNNRAEYFSKLKKYAPVVSNLDFSGTLNEKLFEDSDMRKIKNISKSFESTKKNPKEQHKDEDKSSYSSIIESLKKDSEASGEKS